MLLPGALSGTSATFSSTVSAFSTQTTNFGLSNKGAFNLSNAGSANEANLINFGYNFGTWQPAYIGYLCTSGAGSSNGALVFATRSSTSDVQPTEVLRIASTGAATFSSTVQANGAFRQYIAAGYYADFAYNGTTYNLGSSEAEDNIDFKIAGGGTFTTGGKFRWFTQAGGGTPIERFSIASTGAATFSSTIKTAAPSGGTAQPFKIGSVSAGDPTIVNELEVEINGVLYTIPCSIGTIP
jgi:hypothetical protein